MEFRKTETQNRQLAVSKGNLGNLVTEIGLRYKELNRNSRVEFHIEVEPLKKVIYFDAEVITIILNNLLSNAIKYTPNGQISLSMHPVKVNGTDYTETGLMQKHYAHLRPLLPSKRQTSGFRYRYRTGFGEIIGDFASRHIGRRECNRERNYILLPYTDG